MTAISGLLNMGALPETQRTIGSLISNGYTQSEIARILERPAAWVSEQVQELRLALAEQALKRSQDLPPAFVERLESVRSSTARVAARGSTSSPPTA